MKGGSTPIRKNKSCLIVKDLKGGRVILDRNGKMIKLMNDLELNYCLHD